MLARLGRAFGGIAAIGFVISVAPRVHAQTWAGGAGPPAGEFSPLESGDLGAGGSLRPGTARVGESNSASRRTLSISRSRYRVWVTTAPRPGGER